jgi:hypothetical protein
MQCDKSTFSSLREANAALKTIHHGRVDKEVRPCRAYRCELCHQYHLTSKPLYQEQDTARHRRRRAQKQKKLRKFRY